MILQELIIHNIRSIQDLSLKFPESRILFYGDIGAGKSSVLKAIELALFGVLPPKSASSLLRRGETSGFAELTFLLDGESYTIHRELKTITRKGESKITQSKQWLIHSGTRINYSVSDLRIKILELLNYSIPKYKSTQIGSIDIYRYTVYTPQEDLKAILEASIQERFTVLKEVLDIEKYQNTLTNLKLVQTQLRADCRFLDAKQKTLGEPEEKIAKIEEDIQNQEKFIQELMKKKSLHKKSLTLEEEKLKELRKNNKQLIEDKGKMDRFESDREEALKRKEENLDELKKMDRSIEEKKKELQSIPEIKVGTNKSKAELKTERKDLESNQNQLYRKQGDLKEKISQREGVLENGMCSLCGQKIHDKDQFDQELTKLSQEQKKVISELDNMSEAIQQIDIWLEQLEKFKTSQDDKKNVSQQIEQEEKRRVRLSAANLEEEKKITNASQGISEILLRYKINTIDKFRNVEKELEKKIEEQEQKIKNLREESDILEREYGKEEGKLENLRGELTRLENVLEDKGRIQDRYEKKTETLSWISDHFPGLIEDIKRSVLSEVAFNFNQYFREWFAELVEDENIELELNSENLHPIVQMGGYESPFEEMSGGERSALALAYRLALNEVISHKYRDIKTKGLLVLDEPTDGFSQKQLKKMQQVFDKLDVNQLIVISHEPTLDSLADDHYEFSKDNGVTKVSNRI
jgi:exonuclease SbcC